MSIHSFHIHHLRCNGVVRSVLISTVQITAFTKYLNPYINIDADMMSENGLALQDVTRSLAKKAFCYCVHYIFTSPLSALAHLTRW